jgi:hypothetical protein
MRFRRSRRLRLRLGFLSLGGSGLAGHGEMRSAAFCVPTFCGIGLTASAVGCPTRRARSKLGWRIAGRAVGLSGSSALTAIAAFDGAFVDHALTDRLHALYHSIALRDLRRGEAIGLRWTDVRSSMGSPPGADRSRRSWRSSTPCSSRSGTCSPTASFTRTAARGDLLTIRPSRPRPRTWDITDTRSDTQSRPHPTTALQVRRKLSRPVNRWIEDEPVVKSEGGQRKSDGVLVPLIGVQHNAPGGKGPDFGHARGGGKHEGVAGTARSSAPDGPQPRTEPACSGQSCATTRKTRSKICKGLPIGPLRGPIGSPSRRDRRVAEGGVRTGAGSCGGRAESCPPVGPFRWSAVLTVVSVGRGAPVRDPANVGGEASRAAPIGASVVRLLLRVGRAG